MGGLREEGLECGGGRKVGVGLEEGSWEEGGGGAGLGLWVAVTVVVGCLGGLFMVLLVKFALLLLRF